MGIQASLSWSVQIVKLCLFLVFVQCMGWSIMGGAVERFGSCEIMDSPVSGHSGWTAKSACNGQYTLSCLLVCVRCMGWSMMKV